MNSEGVYKKKTRGGRVSFERKRGSFIDRVVSDLPYESNKRNEKTKQERDNDTQIRKKINRRIIELRDMGVSKEEALEKLKEEFHDSEFASYFQSWVENMYKNNKKHIDPYNGIVRVDKPQGEER